MSENQNEARDLAVVLRELAETSSLHGIPKIVSSRQLSVKILWLLLVLATASLTGYQLYRLITEFRSNSVITKLRMSHSKQNLPDITFCNMNAVRRSKAHIFSWNIKKDIFPEEYNTPGSNAGYSQSMWIAHWNRIKTELKKLPPSEVMKVGHKMEDIMVDSIYDEATLVFNESNMVNFTTSDYGNCFKIHSLEKRVRRSGPDYGLKLVLNLEQSEYIHELASGTGLRLVLSEPGTFAMPSEDGITISGGFDTNIGLRTVRVSRLGEPFGNCTDGEQFYKQYGRKYSVNACMQFCRVQQIIQTCGCLTKDSFDFNTPNSTGFNVCGGLCELRWDYDSKNSTVCDCPNACSEIVYEKAVSGRLWPSEEYMSRVLMPDMCEKNISSLETACQQHRNGTFNPHKYAKNFLTVRIFFEDLKYEIIEEAPMYEPVRFISDMGGALGLFLGVSVLSLVEVLQLILELGLYASRCLRSATRIERGTPTNMQAGQGDEPNGNIQHAP